MNEEQKRELGEYWLEKAERSYKTAKNEYHEGNNDFCVNRLYYAVFYVVSAVLIIRGQNYRKHTAVRAAVHRDFVKPGTISVEFGKLILIWKLKPISEHMNLQT